MYIVLYAKTSSSFLIFFVCPFNSKQLWRMSGGVMPTDLPKPKLNTQVIPRQRTNIAIGLLIHSLSNNNNNILHCVLLTYQLC